VPLLAPLAWIEAALPGRFARTAQWVAHGTADLRAHPDVPVTTWGWRLLAL
jgi:hypothetical protein